MNRNKVVLDALSIYTSLNLLTELTLRAIPPKHEKCFNNLLTSALFWEDMYLPERGYIDTLLNKYQHDSLIAGLRSLFVPLKSSIYIPFESVQGSEKYTKDLKDDKYHEKDVENYHQRTSMYLEIVAEKEKEKENLSYIPHPLRLERIASKTQTRNSILELIDKTIVEHPKSKVTSFETPLIIDYIKKQAGSLPREQLRFVLEERKKAEIRQLQQSLDKLELRCTPDSIMYDHILREELNEMVNICFNRNSIKKFVFTPTVTTTGGVILPVPLSFRYSKKPIPEAFLLDLILFRTTRSNAVK